MKRSWILSLSLGTLAGCATLAGPLGSTADGPVTLRLQPTVQDGGLRTQALVRAWTRSDIEHVVVRLKRVDGGSEADVLVAGSPVMVDVASRSLSAPIVLNGLKRNTTYRVRASAYKAPGEAAENLISEGDGSKATVTVGVDDAPPLAALPIKLKDQVFSATATTSFDIVSGSVTYEGNPAATFEVPPPLGTFETLTATMPYGIIDAAPLKVGNKLYLIAGSVPDNPSSASGTKNIAAATLDSDGNPGAFQLTALKTFNWQAYPIALKVGDYVYLLSRIFALAIDRARINGDGSLGAFEATGKSTLRRDHQQYFTTHNYIYSVGGQNGVKGIVRAPINPDGSLGDFTSYAGVWDSYEPGASPTVIELNGKIHIVPVQAGKPRATLTLDSSGDIAQFNAESGSFTSINRSFYLLLDDFLYGINTASSGTNSGTALFSQVDASGNFAGMSGIGSFTGLLGRSGVVYRSANYVYVFGGTGGGIHYVPSAIQRAPIN